MAILTILLLKEKSKISKKDNNITTHWFVNKMYNCHRKVNLWRWVGVIKNNILGGGEKSEERFNDAFVGTGYCV